MKMFYEVTYSNTYKTITIIIEARDITGVLAKFEDIANKENRAGDYWWDERDIDCIKFLY